MIGGATSTAVYPPEIRDIRSTTFERDLEGQLSLLLSSFLRVTRP